MRAETGIRRDDIDDAVAQLLGIERAYPNALNLTALGDHFEQVREFNRRRKVLPVAAKMNAAQRRFLETAAMNLVERFDHAPRLDAARSAARERHDAERAKLVASFLQLEEGSSMPSKRDRFEVDLRALLAEVRHHHTFALSQSNRALKVFSTIEADDRVDLHCLRKTRRRRLREAARHYHASRRIQSLRATRQTQALGVGAIRHGAGVDDVYVGGFVELAALHPAPEQARFDSRRIVLI